MMEYLPALGYSGHSADLILWVHNVAEPKPEQRQQPQFSLCMMGAEHFNLSSHPNGPSL